MSVFVQDREVKGVNMEAVVFQGVNKEYGHNKIGLENINFSVKSGEFVFIIGRSGAGKSTLLKLISNQINATSGKILINQKNITNITKKERPYLHRQIGIMQNEFGLLDDLNIYDNIMLALRALEVSKKQAKQRVMQIMNTMGIQHIAKHYPCQISQGEVARALLARAMIVNPSILVADEPTANLDPDTSWDIMCLLNDLNQMGVTIIVVSHNIELVSIMKKRVMTLTAGRLVSDKKNAIYNCYDSDAISERRILNERKLRKTV